jgi:hypothetical protein
VLLSDKQNGFKEGWQTVWSKYKETSIQKPAWCPLIMGGLMKYVQNYDTEEHRISWSASECSPMSISKHKNYYRVGIESSKTAEINRGVRQGCTFHSLFLTFTWTWPFKTAKYFK